MAEINFGLIDTQAPARIANALMPSPEQQGAQALQVMQMQHAAGQNELAKYTLAQAKRSDELQNKMLAGLQGATTIEQEAAVLRSVGKVKEARELLGSGLTQRKTLGEITAQDIKANQGKLDAFGAGIAPLAAKVAGGQNITHEDVFAVANQLKSQGLLDDTNIRAIPMDARQLPAYVMGLATATENARKALETHMPKALLANDSLVNTNLMAGKVGDVLATVPTSAFNTRRLELMGRDTAAREQQAQTSKGQLALSRQRLTEELATGKFTPDTVDFLAQTYIQTGNIPALGMGKAAAQLRQLVIARASALARAPATGEAPISAADAARTVGQNKQEFAGGTAGQRTLGTTLANVTSAATEANNMIPIVEKYAALVDPTDFPLVNAAGNFVSRQGGGEAIVGLAGSLNALVNAYARAINPKGVSTVSDKNHAREIITSSMAKGQINTALSVMRAEMESAMAAPKQVKEAMRAGSKTPAAPTRGVDTSNPLLR